LGYLESGITEPLNRFAEKMLDYSTLLKELVCPLPMPELHLLLFNPFAS
jgi:sorting nexin-4